MIYAACQWGMLVVLAKLTSPEQVGLFALGLAVTAPIFLFSQLQLRGVQATDARDEYQFGHYLGLRLITTFAALLVLGAVLGFSSYDRTAVLVILAVALSKAFESIADVFYGLLQRHERMDRIARSRIIKGPLALALLAIIVYATGNVAAGALGLAAAWGIVLVIYDLRNAGTTLAEAKATGENSCSTRIRPIFQTGALARLAWLALPLGLTMALNSFKTNVPKYFIANHLEIADLGIFAALIYMVVAGGLLINAIGQSVTPRLSKYFAQNDLSKFVRLLSIVTLIGLLLGVLAVIIAILFGGIILRTIYGSEYAEYSKLLVLIMIAGATRYTSSFLGFGLTAMRKFQIQLPLAGVTTIFTSLAAYILISKHGLPGAALTLIFSGVLSIILWGGVLMISLKKHQRSQASC